MALGAVRRHRPKLRAGNVPEHQVHTAPVENSKGTPVLPYPGESANPRGSPADAYGFRRSGELEAVLDYARTGVTSPEMMT